MGRSPYQRLSDILVNIEEARSFIGNMSFHEFCGDGKTQRAVLYSLLCASEAEARLRKDFWDFSQQFEIRNEDVNWVRFRGIGNRYRHEYDSIDLELVWNDLSPNGVITQAESAIKGEIALSQITLPARNPSHAEIFKRSETFAQSMRSGAVDLEAKNAIVLEGRLVWFAALPGSEESLVLIQGEKGSAYQRFQLMKADDVKIGDAVTIRPSERGFVLSRNDQQQAQNLRPRIT